MQFSSVKLAAQHEPQVVYHEAMQELFRETLWSHIALELQLLFSFPTSMYKQKKWSSSR
jgi:hypothetical protein